MNGKFSFSTIGEFDSHICSSIPAFEFLYENIISLSSFFVKENTNVFDIGCSTGNLLYKISSLSDFNASYTGFEISDNLIGQSENKDIIKKQDVTKSEFNINNASLVLSVFTLQFLPKNDRIILIEKIYNSLNLGGALIVAEKIISEDSTIQNILNFSHYDFKLKSFSAEEILSKQKSLRSIMFPIKSSENESIFKNAGFNIVEPFFQNLNFKAWILIK